MLILRLRINSLSSMKKFSVLIVLSFALFAFNKPTHAQTTGYNIEIMVNGLADSDLILGHYLGKSMYPDDTITVNSKGYGVFSSDKELSQGLYIVYFADGTYFDLLIGADQHFFIETDTGNYVDNLVANGSLENELFFGFQKYMMHKQKELKAVQAQLQKAEDDKEKEKLNKQLVKLSNEGHDKINSICEQNPDLFVSTFLKATLEVEIPEELQADKAKGFQYYKTHYFDNFDIGDVRLLYTPLYEDKLMQYLDKLVVPDPDTLIAEIDMIMEKAKSDSALFRFVLVKLFSKYGKSNYMGMDAVQVHLAEQYYLKDAWWSDDKYMKELEERIAVLKPLLIGQPAPDIQLRYVPEEHFRMASKDTALKRYPHAGSFFKISDIKADFTILLFWEASCSHCKKVLPQMYEMYQDTLMEQNIQVVAISTLFGEDGKEKWIDFINKKEAWRWINAWNPYDYKYKEIYDVRSTPQIYLLNKEKEIIGKRLGPENIYELIEAYKKHNKDNGQTN